jgi:hypothetical protein
MGGTFGGPYFFPADRTPNVVYVRPPETKLGVQRGLTQPFRIYSDQLEPPILV